MPSPITPLIAAVRRRPALAATLVMALAAAAVASCGAESEGERSSPLPRREVMRCPTPPPCPDCICGAGELCGSPSPPDDAADAGGGDRPEAGGAPPAARAGASPAAKARRAARRRRRVRRKAPGEGASQVGVDPDGTAPPPVDDKRVDINRASAAELQKLPGIGPAMAARIIARRERRPFRRPRELTRVKGIGRATWARLKPLVTVGPE